MRLKEQGKISLDARVSDIAPEIPIVKPWDKTNPVTVAELLEHTGGLHGYSVADSFDFDSGGQMSLLDVLRRFPETLRVRWMPGPACCTRIPIT
jgi:CubicO group peptidase (beta-lactamase class C family)